MSGSERGLAANRDFVRLFAAQATSLVGSGVTSVALAAFAYRLTGRDATVVVGTALTLRILAYVQDDMSRKLPTKSYSRLPHENEEFQEAAAPRPNGHRAGARVNAGDARE